MEKVDDTIMAAGSDAYHIALTFYNSVKNAANAGVPGTDNIYNDLKERYNTARGRSVTDET